MMFATKIFALLLLQTVASQAPRTGDPFVDGLVDTANIAGDFLGGIVGEKPVASLFQGLGIGAYRKGEEVQEAAGPTQEEYEADVKAEAEKLFEQEKQREREEEARRRLEVTEAGLEESRKQNEELRQKLDRLAELLSVRDKPTTPISRGNSCPESHPFTFNSGYHCCANDTDCDGSPLDLASVCCPNNAYVECPSQASECGNAELLPHSRERRGAKKRRGNKKPRGNNKKPRGNSSSGSSTGSEKNKGYQPFVGTKDLPKSKDNQFSKPSGKLSDAIDERHPASSFHTSVGSGISKGGRAGSPQASNTAGKGKGPGPFKGNSGKVRPSPKSDSTTSSLPSVRSDTPRSDTSTSFTTDRTPSESDTDHSRSSGFSKEVEVASSKSSLSSVANGAGIVPGPPAKKTRLGLFVAMQDGKWSRHGNAHLQHARETVRPMNDPPLSDPRLQLPRGNDILTITGSQYGRGSDFKAKSYPSKPVGQEDRWETPRAESLSPVRYTGGQRANSADSLSGSSDSSRRGPTPQYDGNKKAAILRDRERHLEYRSDKGLEGSNIKSPNSPSSESSIDRSPTPSPARDRTPLADPLADVIDLIDSSSESEVDLLEEIITVDD